MIDTIACKFSRHFNIENSNIKCIIYNIKGLYNKININDSTLKKSNLFINGDNNHITLINKASHVYTSIKIDGNNNKLTLNNCSGIFSLTIRGNNCNVSIGPNTTLENCYMICMGESNSIIIGEDCMFSGQVEIWNTDSHLITNIKGEGINPSKPVQIYNHVWVGKHAKILKGVTIGSYSIIGMGSIVTKSINSHSIAAGNPAKIIKENINWKKGFIEI